MREFEGGATRDTDKDKLSYVKALSPIVLKEYVIYLGKHRTCADGSLRDWNNWKQGIPKDIYIDSLGRHFWDVWLLTEGFTTTDNHGDVEMKDALCGLLFNTQGLLFELLKEKK